MSKDNNLTDFLTDVADAIREKKGTTEKINPQDFSDEIKSIKTSTSMWTGHVDVEGLKAIGWDDEDIAYYQEHGVNWMEEDDEYHKVSDDNKALYGVLTADNIQEYKDRIVYLPKIDLILKGNVTKLRDMRGLIALPIIKASVPVDLNSMFYSNTGIKCVKVFAPSITNLVSSFYNCVSLTHIEISDWSSCSDFRSTFYNCRNLVYCNADKIEITGDMTYTFSGCNAIAKLPKINLKNVANVGTSAFNDCTSLIIVQIDNLHSNISFLSCSVLHKYSLMYMIENEAATEQITITLHSVAYARLSTDPDIVAALSKHPLVTLASA